jgi:hypothetical protein
MLAPSMEGIMKVCEVPWPGYVLVIQRINKNIVA